MWAGGFSHQKSLYLGQDFHVRVHFSFVAAHHFHCKPRVEFVGPLLGPLESASGHELLRYSEILICRIARHRSQSCRLLQGYSVQMPWQRASEDTQLNFYECSTSSIALYSYRMNKHRRGMCRCTMKECTSTRVRILVKYRALCTHTKHCRQSQIQCWLLSFTSTVQCSTCTVLY